MNHADATAIGGRVCLLFISLADELLAEGMASSDQRAACLAASAQHWALLKTTSFCLSCLLAKPEHVLSCGHAICDNCVAIFGRGSAGYRYSMTRCHLCLARVDFVARLKPPTAKPRMLTIDGGGIRGVVALALLAGLQQELGDDCPIQDFFDLILGTSSGEWVVRGQIRPLTSQVLSSSSNSSSSGRPLRPHKRSLCTSPGRFFRFNRGKVDRSWSASVG